MVGCSVYWCLMALSSQIDYIMVVSSMSFWTGDKQIIIWKTNVTHSSTRFCGNNLLDLWEALWNLSSQSLGKNWQLNQTTKTQNTETEHNTSTQKKPSKERHKFTFHGLVHLNEIPSCTSSTYTEAAHHQEVLLGSSILAFDPYVSPLINCGKYKHLRTKSLDTICCKPYATDKMLQCLCKNLQQFSPRSETTYYYKITLKWTI